MDTPRDDVLELLLDVLSSFRPGARTAAKCPASHMERATQQTPHAQ